MALTDDEIVRRFGFHPGTDETIPKHERIRQGYIAFVTFLRNELPDGRPKSSCMTKLQESSMWAHFGIAELAPVSNPQHRIVTPGRKPYPLRRKEG